MTETVPAVSTDDTWLRLAISSRRDEIAQVDAELVRLVRKRALAARQLGRLKREAQLPLIQPEQERQVVRRWTEAAGDLDPAMSRRLVRTVIALCREVQA